VQGEGGLLLEKEVEAVELVLVARELFLKGSSVTYRGLQCQQAPPALGNRIGRGGAREARARACRPQKRAKDLMRGCLLWKSRSPCRGARAREAAAEAAVGARGDSCHLLQRILYRHGVSCL